MGVVRYVTHFKFFRFIHSSVVDEASIVIFYTHVGYVKSYQTDDMSPVKEASLWSISIFSPLKISSEWLKLETSNFVHWFAM